MKIIEIWFDPEYIYGKDENGSIHRQSLLWYPSLKEATEAERNNYSIGFGGFHWRDLDEDISFESFFYEDAEPTPLQRFFLTHKEINVGEFAKTIGFNATLLKSYIKGLKKPTVECEKFILSHLHKLGQELTAVSF